MTVPTNSTSSHKINNETIKKKDYFCLYITIFHFVEWKRNMDSCSLCAVTMALKNKRSKSDRLAASPLLQQSSMNPHTSSPAQNNVITSPDAQKLMKWPCALPFKS